MIDEEITEGVIKGAIEVHRQLGPGLLESAYEECLCYELDALGLVYERQKMLPVTYKGKALDCAYRFDLLVENRVIVELKAIEKLLPVHEAQLLTYLRLSGVKTGLLRSAVEGWPEKIRSLNFSVPPCLRGGFPKRTFSCSKKSTTSALPCTPLTRPSPSIATNSA